MKLIFKKPKNKLEQSGERKDNPKFTQTVYIKCPKCKKNLYVKELEENLSVCPLCQHHFRISAKKRLDIMLDSGTLTELFLGIVPKDPINFPGYKEKLESLRQKNPDNTEAVICGVGKIKGNAVAVFAMEPEFLMGSMGSVVGEKITLLFEYAAKNNLPVVGFALSGGARMQEGLFSLMQMAKTSAAVNLHSSGDNLFVSVMCDPTTGGVTASFASLGDIIIAEPDALIGFAGPRVIEQTIRQKLPQGFQRAEFLLEKGFLDCIVPRKELPKMLGTILSLHAKENQL